MTGAWDRRVDLQATGTPLRPMDRLSAHLGLAPKSLWVKRDDLGGFAGGGNKCRKMEHHAAAILTSDADVVVTGGAPQSNHLRVTAAACAWLGIDCVLTVGAEPGSIEGNLLLSRLFGASIRWLGDRPVAEYADEQQRIVAELRTAGRRPYVLPLGGSDAIGDLGYVRCAQEIRAALPAVRSVWCAVGSGGTVAGLLAGFCGAVEVVGVLTAKLEMTDSITALCEDVQRAAGRPGPAAYSPRLITSFAGQYGQEDSEVYAAMLLTARLEGLLLDPVYTGRALAAMLREPGSFASPEAPVVFVHTGGGPAMFSHPYASGLAAQILEE